MVIICIEWHRQGGILTMERTYVTVEGLEKLKHDIEYHKTSRRREIARQLDFARSLGDISENAEYEAAKHALELNEIRIRELEEKVATAELIRHDTVRNGKIFIGASVTLWDLDYDEEVVYQLTGSEETNPSEGKISINSPVARALLGHEVGDLIEIRVPRGILKYKVTAVG
jgi:transcription elongation factor GreA